MIRIKILFWIAILLLPAQFIIAGTAHFVQVEGVIGPATQDLVQRSLQTASKEHVDLIILQIDTPGGLDQPMRGIVRSILNSEVPIVSYVYPSGSRAASAGTYILYASHIAAMAPATHLGAATPVRIGALPGLPSSGGDAGEAEKEPQMHPDAMEKKIVSDSVAYIKSLAKRFGRNEVWAEHAVRDGVSLTAAEALEKKVIDIIAKDVDSLLKRIDGRELELAGKTVILDTSGMVVKRIAPGWRTRLLSVITDPNIAYILMLIGIYGLIFEFSSPGFFLPGVIGAISLMLALYAFQILPVNYTGLTLLAIGVLFMISEVFVTSAGVLGLGGVIAFVVGSIILFDDEYLAVSIPLIAGMALVSSGFMLWVLTRMIRLRRKPSVSGVESMVGKIALVSENFVGRGRVRIEGESWLAESDVEMKAEQAVRIKSVNGLILIVEPKES
jgi:membrane-bound serine protease (ClpP class)